jgi:peptidylprolyl isomerase
VCTLALLTACQTDAEEGADSSAATTRAAGLSLTGSFGSAPTIAFPEAAPPEERQRVVLDEGTGSRVRKGQLVVVDYLGQFWDGEVFDETFSGDSPRGFTVEEGSFFPGFYESIAGARVGSRVLVVAPPPPEAIKEAGTFVFVIDVLAAYGPGATSEYDARPVDVDASVYVSGAPGRAPRIRIPAGLPETQRTSVTVLAEGTGAPVHAGLVVAHLTVVDWEGKPVTSTWREGAPVAALVGAETASPMLDTLAGVPLGSRVLVQVPAQERGGRTKPALVAVIDVLDQPSRDGAGSAAGS